MVKAWDLKSHGVTRAGSNPAVDVFFSHFSGFTTFSRILWLWARSIIRDSMLLLIVDVNFVYYLSLKCLFLRCLGAVFLAWCAFFNPPFYFLKPYIFNNNAEADVDLKRCKIVFWVQLQRLWVKTEIRSLAIIVISTSPRTAAQTNTYTNATLNSSRSYLAQFTEVCQLSWVEKEISSVSKTISSRQPFLIARIT